jgi:hypothetical protein
MHLLFLCLLIFAVCVANEIVSEFAGELKVILSMVTGLEPREQRLLFRGKEREDTDHLHMVGVRDKDKVLLLEDPALKDMKLRARASQVVPSPSKPFIQV